MFSIRVSDECDPSLNLVMDFELDPECRLGLDLCPTNSSVSLLSPCDISETVARSEIWFPSDEGISMSTESSVPPVSMPAGAGLSKPKYVRAVGPRLRKLLYLIFAMLALLVANSGYLASITAIEFFEKETYQNYFYQYMFLGHLCLGLLFIFPFVVFGILHIRNAYNRRNRRAVGVGYALFAVGLLVLATGLLLMRIGWFDLALPAARSAVYWLHVISPFVAAWLYWLHRLAGPRIKWKIGFAYAGVVGVVVVGMVVMHTQDPRAWNVVGSKDGEKYFEPSLARTKTGKFIPASALMINQERQYCVKCHADAHAGWKDSAHHFSSFNNPPYLASVLETREMAMKRDGNVKASRWCAGCHDPVPFFSGQFDNVNFDVVKHPTSQAGITCTVCHAITHINGEPGDGVRGNADFTIEEPVHYPFAYSDNAVLQWINNQLVKAKPSMHKKTFLKPFHKTAEFCATCHKVHLPYELTHYKEFLRGQNHYDSYLLSGVSGHGSRSFYYPPKAFNNCSTKCHMPLKPSTDFGAQLFGTDQLSIHDHLFVGANTGIAWLKRRDKAIEAHKQFLEGVMRVDIFGIKDGEYIDDKLHAPLRPVMPKLKPGNVYLLETVIRTVKMGHHFTQGTVDSNEVWLDVTVRSGNRTIGRSGALDDRNNVDPWSHFVNVFMLDKDGNRIDRRNAQDIVVPLYNHQMPPGAGQTVHYELKLPKNLSAPVTVEVKLLYRKFDTTYMQFVAKTTDKLGIPLRGHKPGTQYKNSLPIVELARDKVTFAIEGVDQVVKNETPDIPVWQRWNDYGIGLLLKPRRNEIRYAADAFREVHKLGRYDGQLNLARALLSEGFVDEAVDAINQAAEFKNPAAPKWTLDWLKGLANLKQNRLLEAEQNFQSVLGDRSQEMIDRGFDFSLDYKVRNLLGKTLFDQTKMPEFRDGKNKAQRDKLLKRAADEFHKTLKLDSENFTAHHNLAQIYKTLGNEKAGLRHEELHDRFRTDDNALGQVVDNARAQYPGANNATEALVIYKLQRDGAYGLD